MISIRCFTIVAHGGINVSDTEWSGRRADAWRKFRIGEEGRFRDSDASKQSIPGRRRKGNWIDRGWYLVSDFEEG